MVEIIPAFVPVTNHELYARFREVYVPKLRAFAACSPVEDAGALQEPHLPLWGSGYSSAGLRLAFVGQDTRKWGNMTAFLNHCRTDSDALFRQRLQEFQELGFKKYGKLTRGSFWLMVYRILASTQGESDWRSIHRGPRDSVLREIVWGEMNSMEAWSAKSVDEWQQGHSRKADWNLWNQLKKASVEQFDRLSLLLSIFEPHVVVVLNWDLHAAYWDHSLNWEMIYDHLRKATDPQTGALIIQSAHPVWLCWQKKRMHTQVATVGECIAKFRKQMAVGKKG